MTDFTPDQITYFEELRQLKSQGFRAKEMAERVGKSVRQIYYDLQKLKDYSRKRAASTDQWTEIGSGIDVLDDIYEMAMQDYLIEEEARERVKFLKLALSAHEKKLEFLSGTGIIPKAATTHNLNIDVPIIEMSLEELRSRKNSIIKDLMSSLPEEDVAHLIDSIKPEEFQEIRMEIRDPDSETYEASEPEDVPSESTLEIEFLDSDDPLGEPEPQDELPDTPE